MELAVDANIASVLVANNGLTQLKAGYCASLLSLPSWPFRLSRSHIVDSSRSKRRRPFRFCADALSRADGSTFGFLNLVTRPAGGWFADRLYAYYGIKAKKYITLVLGFLMGAMSLALGLYSKACWDAGERPDLHVTMGIISLLAIFCEVANGTCL